MSDADFTGYDFDVQYCDMPINSWMWQQVDVFESGVMRNRDGTPDGKTWKRWVVEEVFKVGENGCTVASDTHSQAFSHGACQLCEYISIRTVRQAVNVHPTFLGDREGLSRKLGDIGWIAGSIGSSDPEFNMNIDDPSYHVISYQRDGVPCLHKGKPIRFRTTAILIGAPIVADSGWTLLFEWEYPCGGFRYDMPPPSEPPKIAPMPPEPLMPTDPAPPPTTPPDSGDFGQRGNTRLKFNVITPADSPPTDGSAASAAIDALAPETALLRDFRACVATEASLPVALASGRAASWRHRDDTGMKPQIGPVR